jgi:hypothetical protein
MMVGLPEVYCNNDRHSSYWFWFSGFLSLLLVFACVVATRETTRADKLAKQKTELVLSQRLDDKFGHWGPLQPCRATVTNIHDADTFECVIHLPFGVDLPGRSIRAQGYDAWEVTRARQTVGSITDDEIAKGKKARDELAKLCESQSVWLEPSTNPGVYGRTSANVWLRDDKGQWTELSQYAQEHGWCRDGGRVTSRDIEQKRRIP